MAAAALVCLLAVAFGAFGAHALSGLLQGKTMQWYQTAVQYQFMHGIGMFVCVAMAAIFSIMGQLKSAASSSTAGWCLLTGVLIFCGTLYAMALGAPRWLGAVTPLGGLAFLAGWGLLIRAALTARSVDNSL